MQHTEVTPLEFSAIRLKLASPKEIRSWSHGEVTKPETINYRTQKPEKDGLFSERIFGPAKDWECHCGKYKKIRYKGIVCDKCGVEVTRAIVRRERMAHIELAAPVSHIWFLRGVPSKMGIVLDVSVSNLEKVLYFANFIVLSIDETLRQQTLEQLKSEADQKRKQIDGATTRRQAEAQSAKQGDALAKELATITREYDKDIAELDEAVHMADRELRELEVKKILSETQYRDLSLKYGHVFTAGIGGDAIDELLRTMDIALLAEELEEEVEEAGGARRDRIVRRLKLIRTLIKNNIRPEWMMLTVLPVIPPDLRPMVPLDGGRFATSDLNDLYRRVINRNNRLKQLILLNAPEVIFRNEKRMLQEAVDALIDNAARKGKTVTASTGQKRQLKSIADMLKGKQGRFRQNLLGKRVDYSGRSVIVVGPHLKFNQCGLPKKMALELFKPFIIAKLIQREIVHNVRSASRFIETGAPVVWDILEEVTKGAHVLLNRAPTLHRLGIQAFQPILIEGKAIQVHPMVCAAFNADFDGDQMAVHVPLTEEAKREARERMLSTNNLLKPATGDPVAKPDQDVVWGCFYLTRMKPAPADARVKHFSNPVEAKLAYEMKKVGLQEEVAIRFDSKNPQFSFTDLPENGIVRTTVGRVIFNELFPREILYMNEKQGKRQLSQLVRQCLEYYSQQDVADMLDRIKATAFTYLTRSGLSWGMGDIPRLPEKTAILAHADTLVEEVREQYASGLLTESERYTKIIEIWTSAKDTIVTKSRDVLDPDGSVFSMIDSGARGSWGQLTQIVGMKGLVTNPSGEIIELPVKGSFKDGYEVLEYFISTHGSRKGLSDTALRTANAGYLTRRLVDVAQDVVIAEEDCGDTEGLVMTRETSNKLGEDIAARMFGRMILEDVKEGRKTIVKAGTFVTEAQVRTLKECTFPSVRIRSVFTCKAVRGLCQSCYGYDLSSHTPVEQGVAVGIIAAQSIGEPGTQLTMRTFHTGGVVGDDITQGLPRVEELFEARVPRKKAFLAEGAGKVTIDVEQRTITDATGKQIQVSGRGQRIVKIASTDEDSDIYDTKSRKKKTEGTLVMLVKEGEKVKEGDILFNRADGKPVEVKRAGVVRIPEDGAKVEVRVPINATLEYVVPPGYVVLVKDGMTVEKGQPVTNGSIDLHQLYKLRNKEAVQEYVLHEIQAIYSSQGQRLNDKHIELICRQLFSRVHVEKAGDTDMLQGEIVERSEFITENVRAKEAGGDLAEGRELILGISKVSLSTKSFLSAASFQETAKVLINAAITGKIDHLEGLKENVIIGRLIPAGTGYKKAVARRERRKALIAAAAKMVKRGTGEVPKEDEDVV